MYKLIITKILILTFFIIKFLIYHEYFAMYKNYKSLQKCKLYIIIKFKNILF